MTTVTRPFCNILAREKGLDPAGYAGSADLFVTFELPLPWPRNVWRGEGMPAEVTKLIEVWYGDTETSRPRLRPLAVAPDPLLGTGEASVALSLEKMPELRADHIFLSEDDPERARELKESPLFANVPAVQANHVYTVDRNLWLLGHSSPLGAELIVQDVLEFVSGESE